jgi:hypothetical protein
LEIAYQFPSLIRTDLLLPDEYRVLRVDKVGNMYVFSWDGTSSGIPSYVPRVAVYQLITEIFDDWSLSNCYIYELMGYHITGTLIGQKIDHPVVVDLFLILGIGAYDWLDFYEEDAILRTGEISEDYRACLKVLHHLRIVIDVPRSYDGEDEYLYHPFAMNGLLDEIFDYRQGDTLTRYPRQNKRLQFIFRARYLMHDEDVVGTYPNTPSVKIETHISLHGIPQPFDATYMNFL